MCAKVEMRHLLHRLCKEREEVERQLKDSEWRLNHKAAVSPCWTHSLPPPPPPHLLSIMQEVQKAKEERSRLITEFNDVSLQLEKLEATIRQSQPADPSLRDHMTHEAPPHEEVIKR